MLILGANLPIFALLTPNPLYESGYFPKLRGMLFRLDGLLVSFLTISQSFCARSVLSRPVSNGKDSRDNL